MKDLIIFTDLDGSLLDEETYRASPADSLFGTLNTHGIPVVFNSSKTFPEMLKVRRSMGNHQPFVVENGSNQTQMNYLTWNSHWISKAQKKRQRNQQRLI